MIAPEIDTAIPCFSFHHHHFQFPSLPTPTASSIIFSFLLSLALGNYNGWRRSWGWEWKESVMEGNYNGKQRYFLEVIRQFSYVMLLSLQHSITFYSSLFLAFFLHSIPSRITFSFSLSFPSLSCGRYAQTRPLGRRMRAREGKDERKARNK